LPNPPATGYQAKAGSASGPSRPRFLRARSVVIVLVAVLVIAGVVGWSQASSGPAWPASIAPIAKFVSHDRGLSFLHPVPVHFLSPRAFDRQVAAGDRITTPGERADVRRQASAYRALGLIGGKVNLSGAQTALDTGNVLAYYDDQAKDITVRGTTLDPATKITLAHELTHVLQDQHFNLVNLDNQSNTNDKSFATTALGEGDAVLTENDYGASLPQRQQRQATAEQNAPSGPAPSGGQKSGPSGPTGNSDYLGIVSEVPYVLGPDFVLTLFSINGTSRIDAAFQHPPKTELDIVNPSAYLANETTRTLPPPALSRGEKRDGTSDTFGAFDAYMTLAGVMDARTALAAADGWGGGSEIQYTAGAQSCMKINLVGHTPAQSNLLTSAFATWANALGQHQAVVTRQGQLTAVTACDPGSSATTGTRSRDHALSVLDQRNANIANVKFYQQVTPAVALCVGDQALNDPTLLDAQQQGNGSYGAPASSVQHTVDVQTRDLIATCSRPSPPASP
jgi:hypothetical protein